MKTYWDLSETERAALSADDVQKYVDAELMIKGILKVHPLELEPEPGMPEPAGRVFVVRPAANAFAHLAAFPTRDAAQAFVDLRPLRLESSYLSGQTVAYYVSGPLEIVEQPMFGEDEKSACEAELRRVAAIKSSNETRRREHAEAMRKQTEALRGLWDDWAACRKHVEQLRAVATTFADYVATAEGDRAIARQFLAKVYSEELIAEAVDEGFLEAAPPAEEAAQ